MECYNTNMEGAIIFFAALYCSCHGLNALFAVLVNIINGYSTNQGPMAFHLHEFEIAP